jgi:hypothetical protein
MNAKDIQRYIALDIHKEYLMLRAINLAQEWVIQLKCAEMPHFRIWDSTEILSHFSHYAMKPQIPT